MKQEKKYFWQLFFQAVAATAAVIIFFGLLFVVMNRSQQAIVGVGIQIYPHANGVVVDLYGNGYLLDFTPWQQFQAWCQEHWILVPRWIRAIGYLLGLS